MDWALTAAGFGVGIIVGLTGMGGGALMTPVLVIFFGIPPLAAVSSDLVASAVKPVGSLVHIRHGRVNWSLVRWLCVGSNHGHRTDRVCQHRSPGRRGPRGRYDPGCSRSDLDSGSARIRTGRSPRTRYRYESIIQRPRWTCRGRAYFRVAWQRHRFSQCCTSNDLECGRYQNHLRHNDY